MFRTRSARSKPGVSAPRTRLGLEHLEARETPATYNPTTGVLSMNGSSGNDYLSVSFVAYPPATASGSGSVEIRVQERLGTNVPGGTVQVINASFQFTNYVVTSGFRTISISAGGGNDVLELHTTPLPIAVNVQMGSGSDTVYLGSRGWGNLDGLDRATIVIADSGTAIGSIDRLYVNDQGGRDRNLIVTANSVAEADTASFTNPVQFSGIEFVEVNAGDEANEITVLGTPQIPTWDPYYADVQLRVNGRGGDDFVMVGDIATEVAEVISGALEVIGGEGDDRLRLRDDSSQTWTFYRVTGDRVEHNLARDIRYDTERLDIYCGWRENSLVAEESAFSRWVTYDGGGGSDTLDVANVEENWWYLDGYASGDVNNTIKYINVEGLMGGEGRDTFHVWPNGSGAWFDASTGEDLLDYSALTTGVTVNLNTHSADRTLGVWGFENVTGGWGNDTITGDVWNNVIRGGGGNDTLYGDAGADVLLGEAGNDRLFGSWGRDFLIGGIGVDELDGGPEEDILVAGTTNRDGDTTALKDILGVWRSTTLDYGQRMADIRGRMAVYVDSDRDTLRGGDGYDWLWADPERYEAVLIGSRWVVNRIPADLITDYTSPEQVR